MRFRGKYLEALEAGERAAFVEWTSTEDSLGWEEAMRKLEKPTFYHKEAIH